MCLTSLRFVLLFNLADIILGASSFCTLLDNKRRESAASCQSDQSYLSHGACFFVKPFIIVPSNIYMQCLSINRSIFQSPLMEWTTFRIQCSGVFVDRIIEYYYGKQFVPIQEYERTVWEYGVIFSHNFQSESRMHHIKSRFNLFFSCNKLA